MVQPHPLDEVEQGVHRVIGTGAQGDVDALARELDRRLMVRLRNTTNDVVVNVSDEVAALVGSDWRPVDEEKKPAAKTPAPRRGSKPAEPDDE